MFIFLKIILRQLEILEKKFIKKNEKKNYKIFEKAIVLTFFNSKKKIEKNLI